MDKRQLDLRLATAEEKVERLREYLRPVGLAPRLVAAACVIVARGDQIQVCEQTAVRLQIAKQDAAEMAKRLGLTLSPNTWVAAVSDLEARRIVGVLRTTRPWTYVLSLPALDRLEARPADTLSEISQLPLFRPPEESDGPDQEGDRSGLGQPSVNPRSGPRVREYGHLESPCPPESVSRDRGARTGLADRLRRPWDRQSGLTGDDLAAAIRTGDLEPLRRLYREAKQLEWVGGAEDDLLRFLTAVHHVATVDGLANRMAALVARVKREPIDVSRCRHASEDWAAQVIRRSRQPAEVVT